MGHVRVWVHAARVRALTFMPGGRVEEAGWGRAGVGACSTRAGAHFHAGRQG